MDVCCPGDPRDPYAPLPRLGGACLVPPFFAIGLLVAISTGSTFPGTPIGVLRSGYEPMRRFAVSRALGSRCHRRPDRWQAELEFLGGDYHQRLRAVRRVWIVTMMALVLSIGGASEAHSRPHPAGHPSAVEGTASWYGWRQHGRRMANGQSFHALCSAAASSHLPLGSRVKVTNLANHRVAWVTIKDREPATRGRVVDVSLGTARALGMEKQGLTKVRLEVAKQHVTRRVRGPDLGTPKRRADRTVPGTHRAAVGRLISPSPGRRTR
jgi:rare lipoprotein A